MTPERWQQIEEIFQTALDMEQEERARFVAEACADDSDLKSEVEKLLAQYAAAGEDFGEPLSWGSSLRELASQVGDEHDPVLGQVFGSYRIERQIGRGGMGAVYEAARADGEFQQRVAIKLVKRGMDSDFIVGRFRNERQILATLEHPNIAYLLDGGTSMNGLPYFVMEYVEGQPLYAYADGRRLSIRERLQLFCRICDAVHYAHQKKIIHRDLKPSNILVSADGTPKLLDFGIAKLLDPDMALTNAPQTATAVSMMTVEYASPEQVQGMPVTFLSDVYSLGVLLYELLTGHRPYRFRSRAPYEVARSIIEDEPELPSKVTTRLDNALPVGHLGQEALSVTHLAELRGETATGLQRTLRGSLDSIALKALRKEPTGRYESTAALREDIVRYLNGQTVFAPPYQAMPTFAEDATARDAAAHSIAVLPLKVLNFGVKSDTGEGGYLGVGLTDAMISRLSGVRSLAVRPTSAVMSYSDEATDPAMAGRELGVDYVLDGRIKMAGQRVRVSLQLLDVRRNSTVWANQFDERFADALELEDSISEKVSEAILPRLSGDKQARLKKRGTDNAEAFATYSKGRYFWNQFTVESFNKARGSFEKAIELDPTYALPYVGLADYYVWANIYGLLKTEESRGLARAAALRALELDDRLGESYAILALLAQNNWSWAEAEMLYQRALELNPNYSLAYEWHSSFLVGTGRFEQGLREIRRAEELDPLSLRAMTLTTWTLYQARRFAEAEAKARQIIAMDANYPQGHIQLGNILEQTGRAEESIIALREGVRLLAGSEIPKYPLCFSLVRVGQREDARAVLEEMKETASTRHVKPYFLAMGHAALGEFDEAFAYFEPAFADRDPWLLWFGTEPKLDPLRDDPRFVRLLKRTANPILNKIG